MALTQEQIDNLNKVLEIIKSQKITDPNTGEVKDRFTAEQAHIALWIANVESRFDESALNTDTGASGIYQYKDDTWEGRCYNGYGQKWGYSKDDWEANKDDLNLQTKVFLEDFSGYITSMSWGGGTGALGTWSYDGLPGQTRAKDSMDNTGVPWTLENYIYLRHNTSLREEKKVILDRLLDLGGSFSDVEKAVETAYGKQITDPYDNPSLSPLIKKLADAVHLNIEGMTNQEALGWIRERYSRLNKTNHNGVEYLLKCLSGYNKLETSKLWQYWNNTRSLFSTASVTRSPILLDLDGDGVIKTLGTDAGIHFDHDGNGFKELSGWVAEGDGMLMLDRDADAILDNGAELFGNFTPLANGMLAVNGFQALAQFDSNGDGKIDASDPIWSQLRVWQHDPEATDTGDPDSAGIFKTLDELGIQSINTGYTDTNITDPNGNTIKQAGSFTKTDGSTGNASDVWFQTDNMYTIANEWLDVPDDIAALPDLQGYGNVYDLQQAMARERRVVYA